MGYTPTDTWLHKQADHTVIRHLDYLCGRCHRAYVIHVEPEDYDLWCAGEGPKRHAQEAFPYLDADDRELMISGTCGTCWTEMFGTIEDAP